MKNVIIIEDDSQLALLMQEHINDIEDYNCDLIYTNPIDYLRKPVFANIILLDIVMPEMNGLEMIEKILEKFPDTSIIINSIKDDSETIFKALKLGAIGYIDKQGFLMNFEEVFECVANDGAYMTTKIARKIILYFQKPKEIYEKLTARETEVSNAILEGLSYKLISYKYEISIDTVRMHIKNIYRKLKINSKSELFNVFRSNH